MSEDDPRQHSRQLDASIRKDAAQLHRIKTRLGLEVWKLYEEIDPDADDDVFFGAVMEFATSLENPAAFSSELTQEQNELVDKLKAAIIKALTQRF